MNVPVPLQSHITMLRRMVEKMDRLNAEPNLRNVDACIGNIRANILPDAQFESSVLSVVSTARDLYGIVATPFPDERTVALREAALAAADQMANRLANCKPSKRAQILGLDW